jgi:hypothetical protein
MTKYSITLIILVIFLIFLSVGIAGCSSQTPSASPVPDKKVSTIEPSQMALQLSDLPVNFIVLEKGERNISNMRSWAVDHGWKKGYIATYQRNNQSSLPGTIIQQVISVYSAENITLIVPDTVNTWKNISAEEKNVTIEELTLPTIGDSSSSLRAYDTSDNTQEYLIAFVKDDVYEQLYTNGTVTDYETLKKLAGIAAAKIT